MNKLHLRQLQKAVMTLQTKPLSLIITPPTGFCHIHYKTDVNIILTFVIIIIISFHQTRRFRDNFTLVVCTVQDSTNNLFYNYTFVQFN